MLHRLLQGEVQAGTLLSHAQVNRCHLSVAGLRVFQSIGQRSWRFHRSISSFLLLSLFQLSQIPPRFVAVSVLDSRQQTSNAKLTTNPTYAAKDATFDFPIYLSLADKLGVVELVVCDKDMLSKEYLGEVALPLDDLFVDRQTGNQKVIWF